MIRVVAAEIGDAANRELDVEREILGADVELELYAHEGGDDDFVSACRNADVILTGYAPVTRAVIEGLARCRLISVAATGYDCVDVTAAIDAGVSVCAVDEYCTDEVADHTMLLLLALCRHLPEYHHQVQSQHRWQFDSISGLSRLGDMTLGIVGFGRIGQAVARRGRGFGMTTLACDPGADADAATRLGVRLCDLATLLAESDVVTLHCGLSPDTRHLLDEDAFRRMRKKPMLINCARGGLIDETALIAALDTGKIAGAGLDVLDDEAPKLSASQLLGRDNVIVTPHVAFYSDASILANRRVSAGNIRAFLDGNHGAVRRYVHRATD